MSKKKSMYCFMIFFAIGSIVLLFDGYNYYVENAYIDNEFCGCEKEDLNPYLCPVRFSPFSSFAVSNYFYFMGIVFLMLYYDIPSFTEIYRLLKNKYLLKKDELKNG